MVEKVSAMIDVRLPELRAYAFEGKFGLEREALRVTEPGG